MCPACMATAALIAAGTVSTSALGALLLQKGKPTKQRATRPQEYVKHTAASETAQSGGMRGADRPREV